MKLIKLSTMIFASLAMLSCGSSLSSSESLSDIETQLNSQFGDNAYYTEISITHNKAIGHIVNAVVTDSPESLQMGQWTQTQGTWTQTSNISIEIPEGTKAADFMFQLTGDINLKKLDQLVEDSKKNLSEEKQIKNPTLHMAFIKYPDTGEVSKAEYMVMLQPEHGGTTFTYAYTIGGELINMDY